MQQNNFLSLEQVIDRQPLTVTPDTLLIQVIRQMQGGNNSCALVIEGNQLQGIFTAQDLVNLVAVGRDLTSIAVGEVMSQELITLKATGSIDVFTALNLLCQHRIRYLAIIDAGDRLLGLVTMDAIWEILQPKVHQWETEKFESLQRKRKTENLESITDISDRQQVEEVLQRQALIFNSLYDAVILTDLEGRIIDWNPSAERMFGYSKSEVLGQTLGILHQPEESAILTQQVLEGIIDDEPPILAVTKATLETYNYQVLTAGDGLEAIAVYAHNLNSIKVVIMDMMMPNMDGKTAILALKQINPAVKIIVVSGLVLSQEIISDINDHLAGFLTKPYSNDDLLRAINEVVSC